MKIDMHCHTWEYSPCAADAAAEVVRAAKRRGLDGVVITDHHRHLSEGDRRRLEQAAPGIRVFRGAEIGIRDPSNADVADDLVVVSAEPCVHLDPVRPDEVERLAEFAEATGALIILAHPFRYRPNLSWDLGRYSPDAVEVASNNTPREQRDRIESLARKYGMQPVVCTDAHRAEDVGAYFIELDEPVGGELELAEAVRAGAFRIAPRENS
jgi:predicted metal-dependent phosphoesterase TrpH